MPHWWYYRYCSKSVQFRKRIAWSIDNSYGSLATESDAAVEFLWWWSWSLSSHFTRKTNNTNVSAVPICCANIHHSTIKLGIVECDFHVLVLRTQHDHYHYILNFYLNSTWVGGWWSYNFVRMKYLSRERKSMANILIIQVVRKGLCCPVVVEVRMRTFTLV